LFFWTVKQGKLPSLKSLGCDISTAVEPEDPKEHPVEEIIPQQYHEFLLLVSQVLADQLLPDRPGIDYKLRLMQAETPSWAPLY
jgi:hypothetical protein